MVTAQVERDNISCWAFWFEQQPMKNSQEGFPCIATRSKDATRGSWPYYTRNKKLLVTRASLLVTKGLLLVANSY